jgi:hypothetical protein
VKFYYTLKRNSWWRCGSDGQQALLLECELRPPHGARSRSSRRAMHLPSYEKTEKQSWGIAKLSRSERSALTCTIMMLAQSFHAFVVAMCILTLSAHAQNMRKSHSFISKLRVTKVARGRKHLSCVSSVDFFKASTSSCWGTCWPKSARKNILVFDLDHQIATINIQKVWH